MELNTEQAEAIAYTGPHRNILVVSGAGCGKTRTIIARAAHLIKRGTDPARLLIMTFTNRSGRELRVRLRDEVGEPAETIQAGTFHAFCLKVMTRIPNSFGISGLHIIDSDDQESLMGLVRKSLIKQLQGPRRGFPSPNQLLSYYSYSRNTVLDPQQYVHSQTDLEDDQVALCVHMFASYQQMKEECGYLDYDDLLIRFTDSLQLKPKLREAVCTLFDEVLVDEMQDTNPIQSKLLGQFSTERVRLFCVGDPAQSIYRFRGAEFRHMMDFNSIFGDSIQFGLSKNYRSYQEILDVATWLLHRSTYDYPTKLVAARGTGNQLVRLEDFEHHEDECSWIADRLVDFMEHKISLSEIMILYRSAYEARTLEAQLIRRGIAYRFIGGIVLTKSAHVRDVLALLRLARDPRDNLAWMRYLQLWPRIGERTAQRILDSINEGPPGQVIDLLGDSLGTDHLCTVALKETLSLIAKPVECITEATEHLRPVLSQRYDRWQQRSKDFDVLVQVARNYRSVSQFIDDFTLEPMNDTQIANEHNDDAVTLITVHSAKGTEARICFVASATQTNYPHFKSLGDLDAEEEERRVLYVACTRAKDELIITRSAINRNAFWVKRSPAAGEPYFLQDVPESLVTRTLHGWSESNPGGLGSLQDIY